MGKVCILGTAETLKEAPLNDSSFDFWALNDMYDVVSEERINRWFEIHSLFEIQDSVSRKTGKSHIEWLKNCKIPVYMQDKHEDIPTSVKYPIDEILDRFGTDYFHSTIDYEIAIALYEGYKEIHIYGVNMAINEEYGYQRPSACFWLGVAKGMGVKVVLPKSCDLLKGYYRYGYNYLQQSDFEKKALSKITQLENESAQYQKNYYLAMGAKSAWEYILRESKG